MRSLSLLLLMLIAASPVREHARLLAEGRALLRQGKTEEARAALMSAMRLYDQPSPGAPLIDPASALWVAAQGAAIELRPKEPCVFWPTAVMVQRQLAEGKWQQAEVGLRALERSAGDCKVASDDPRRSTLLAYIAFVRMQQGDHEGSKKLRKQALSIRQKSIEDDDLEDALFKLMEAANTGGAEAKRSRGEARRMLANFPEQHAVVRACAEPVLVPY